MAPRIAYGSQEHRVTTATLISEQRPPPLQGSHRADHTGEHARQRRAVARHPISRHEVILNVDLPGPCDGALVRTGVVCTRCGTIGAAVRPNWNERER